MTNAKMAAYCRGNRARLVSCFILLLCICVCLVSSEYKLKDLEFDFKPGDSPPRIFTADEIAEYDGSDVSGRLLLPLKPSSAAVSLSAVTDSIDMT